MNYRKMLSQIKKQASSRRLLQCACVLLLFLILKAIVTCVYLLPHLNSTLQSNKMHDKTIPSKAHESASLTSDGALFGEYVPKNIDSATIRPSMLNFTVVGVLFSVNEEASQVMLQKPNGQAHFYHVGDALPGDVVIKRITPESVLFSRDGVLERLSLPNDSLHFEPKAEPMNEE